MNLAAGIQPNHDLPTIDLETFSGLSSEVDTSPLAMPITPSTPSVPLSTKCATDNVDVPVGEEVILLVLPQGRSKVFKKPLKKKSRDTDAQ